MAALPGPVQWQHGPGAASCQARADIGYVRAAAARARRLPDGQPAGDQRQDRLDDLVVADVRRLLPDLPDARVLSLSTARYARVQAARSTSWERASRLRKPASPPAQDSAKSASAR